MTTEGKRMQLPKAGKTKEINWAENANHFVKSIKVNWSQVAAICMSYIFNQTEPRKKEKHSA